MRTPRRIIRLLVVAAVVSTVTYSFPALCQPTAEEALDAMKTASAFMTEEASTRGGHVWMYAADLSRKWGEIPARESQIWVQGATNGVGEMYLDLYETLGDPLWLERAKHTANAIVWGQYPEGGWHYLIDFDMPGIRNWYDEVASRCWGWEEYYHYYGNCTYDDDATASSIRLLMRLYMLTLDPAYREPLLKGLEFVLESQYPRGGWPQRYPLMYEHVKQGIPDYTHYYTFNDHVMRNNILLLWDAWRELGDERYRDAAVRGMDFYLVSQGGPDQPAWGEQHRMDLLPGHARTYEPAGYDTRTTTWNIRDLQYWYALTGDRRYLDAVPAALDWLDRVEINDDPAKGFTHARRHEIGTNRPIYIYREGTSIDNGGYYMTYTLGEKGAGGTITIDTDALRRQFERTKSMTPAEAREAFGLEKTDPAPGLPDTGADEIAGILAARDDRGIWLEDITIRNFDDPQKPGTVIPGIMIRTYITNMRKLAAYVAGTRE